MINYEGISYNLETIIEFKSLKLLLEALAKKQIEHNILFYGQNNNIVKINSNEVINAENIQDKTENNNNEKIENNDSEQNLEKIWMEKINNSGLIKAFIESQKKLQEQNNLINDLKNRIDSLEKNKTRTFREKKETKRIINPDKDSNNKEQGINTKKENEVIKEEPQKGDEKNEILNKDNTKEINEGINKDEKNNQNIIINKIINKPVIKEDNILNEPMNSESKTINIYDKKIKTNIQETYNNEKYEKKFSDLDNLINSLNERLDELEQNTDNNTNDIETNKDNISHLNKKIKNLEKELENSDNNKISTPIPEPKIKEEEKKIEETNINENDEKLKNLEEQLNNLEQKILNIIEERFSEMKQMKRTSSDSSNMKEFISEKEKIKESIDKLYKEINGLKKKEQNLEDKLKELTPLIEIKRIDEKIKLMEQDMEEYATKNDIRHIISEIDKYEKELSKNKSFIINQKETNNKHRDEIAILKKAFDNLKQNISSLNMLLESNSLSRLIENLNSMNDKIVEKAEYEETIKTINKKISEIQMDVNEHNRSLVEIKPKISNMATMDDINHLQKLIDELMSKSGTEITTKSPDTEEIIKNIKSIEAQVKIFMKKLETENEKEKLQNENCILASRPVGGFKCASCETYIGDIKESNVFLPWNKYHGQDRPYRLGSSFSRILQGLNIEQNFNPFLMRQNLLKSESNKRNKLTTESLSVKRVRKIPPLTQITLTNQNSGKKNNFTKTIDEHVKTNDFSGSGVMFTNKLKKKLNANYWGIKSLKNLTNEKNVLTMNILNRSRKKKDNSYEKDNSNSKTKSKSNRYILEEKVVKITKKTKENKNNNKSEDNENHLVIPSL